jgi:light-regulated signal transduction histidine kinase (bacteriophytochrome)
MNAVVTSILKRCPAEQIRMSTLFQNLISNALKYVRKGEAPRIHISAKQSGAECTPFLEGKLQLVDFRKPFVGCGCAPE